MWGGGNHDKTIQINIEVTVHLTPRDAAPGAENNKRRIEGEENST